MSHCLLLVWTQTVFFSGSNCVCLIFPFTQTSSMHEPSWFLYSIRSVRCSHCYFPTLLLHIHTCVYFSRRQNLTLSCYPLVDRLVYYTLAWDWAEIAGLEVMQRRSTGDVLLSIFKWFKLQPPIISIRAPSVHVQCSGATQLMILLHSFVSMLSGELMQVSSKQAIDLLL